MKITKTMLAIIFCIAFSLSFSANAISETEFYYQDEDVTVTFDVESSLSDDQKQFIADKIVAGEPIVYDGISTYSLCWLTGHDIITEVVFAVEHKVSPTVPRCKKNTYSVESCEKCDYMEYSLASSAWILCCPEE